MTTPKYSIPCGHMYDPRTDKSHTFYLCDNWARWELTPRDGIRRDGCSSHINKVLNDLVVDGKRIDITVMDMLK